jgi:hypothetical protein
MERQREAEVGHEVALVKFVENDEADTVERRIALQASCENSFGDDLDARVLSHSRFSAGSESNRPTDCLAEQFSHSMRGRSCCDAARLEHDDPTIEPWDPEHRKRNERRLPGARRSLQNRSPVRRHDAVERRKNVGDGKIQHRFRKWCGHCPRRDAVNLAACHARRRRRQAHSPDCVR